MDWMTSPTGQASLPHTRSVASSCFSPTPARLTEAMRPRRAGAGARHERGGAGAGAGADVPVYAAGSLREVLTEVAGLWRAQGGWPGGAGPSAPRGCCASASSRVSRRRCSPRPTPSIRSAWLPAASGRRRWCSRASALCALAAPPVEATPQTLLATLLRKDIRLGTSTPRADPSGDYAWALFRKAEAVRPGAYAALDAKALKLTGGPDFPPSRQRDAAPMPG